MNAAYLRRVEDSQHLFVSTQQTLLEKIAPLEKLISSFNEWDKARPYEEIREQLQTWTAKMQACDSNELPTALEAHRTGLQAIRALTATLQFCDQLPLLSVAAINCIPRSAENIKLKENSVRHDENKTNLNENIRQLNTLVVKIEELFGLFAIALSEIQKLQQDEKISEVPLPIEDVIEAAAVDQ